MEIQLEYCAKWNYEPQAVSLTAKLLPQVKQRIARLVLIPSGGGCFEITVGGKLIYSKLKTGEFPDENRVLKEIEAALNR